MTPQQFVYVTLLTLGVVGLGSIISLSLQVREMMRLRRRLEELKEIDRALRQIYAANEAVRAARLEAYTQQLGKARR